MFPDSRFIRYNAFPSNYRRKKKPQVYSVYSHGLSKILRNLRFHKKKPQSRWTAAVINLLLNQTQTDTPVAQDTTLVKATITAEIIMCVFSIYSKSDVYFFTLFIYFCQVKLQKCFFSLYGPRIRLPSAEATNFFSFDPLRPPVWAPDTSSARIKPERAIISIARWVSRLVSPSWPPSARRSSK